MFEVYDIFTGKIVRRCETETEAWDWVNSHDYLMAEGYGVRLNEDPNMNQLWRSINDYN